MFGNLYPLLYSPFIKEGYRLYHQESEAEQYPYSVTTFSCLDSGIRDLTVLSICLASGVGYVNYVQFQGFEPTTATSKTTINSLHKLKPATVLLKTFNVTVKNDTTVNATVPRKHKNKNSTRENNLYPTHKDIGQRNPKINVKEFNTKCPENKLPSSIGTYEIPTERDLVLFTKRTLLKMFNSYHEKTLHLLKDIKEVTHATAAVEKKCHGSGKGKSKLYKQCVKQVSRKFITVTKGLVQSLERQEAEVIALTKNKICNLASMKTNPIQLIQVLAKDEASLVFALPAFLRLVGSCAVHCKKRSTSDHRPRLRQLSDQELVVRHFLTSKNYLQLLNDKHV